MEKIRQLLMEHHTAPSTESCDDDHDSACGFEAECEPQSPRALPETSPTTRSIHSGFSNNEVYPILSEE